jgi:hypothetical protein
MRQKNYSLNTQNPLNPTEDVALYYLGLVALQKKDIGRAYQYASLLETINREYANSLYFSNSPKGCAFGEDHIQRSQRPELFGTCGNYSIQQRRL